MIRGYITSPSGQSLAVHLQYKPFCCLPLDGDVSTQIAEYSHNHQYLWSSLYREVRAQTLTSNHVQTATKSDKGGHFAWFDFLVFVMIGLFIFFTKLY